MPFVSHSPNPTDTYLSFDPAGLADRRERKRLRKAIVSAKPSETTSQESSEVEKENADDVDEIQGLPGKVKAKRGRKQKEKGKKKEKQGKAAKIPAGLALIYGFSSTNIGKNRLTVWCGSLV